MQQKTIDKYERILDEIINRRISVQEYCKETGQNLNSFRVQMSNIAKGAIEDIEVRERLLSKYEIVKSQAYDPISQKETEIVEEVETDDRAETSVLRDDNGHIKFYSYTIFRKNKIPLCGTLTREEMNTIYRLYSFYGDSLPQRIISRHFTDLSLIDLKRILRAFNITKASAPFAPHMFEEKSEEELREIQLREKENSFLRKAEEDQIKNNEKLLKKYAQENIELKKQLDTLSNLKVDIERIEPYVPNLLETEQNVALNLYLSDVHLGATVETGTLFDENINYGKEEAQRRLSKIIDKLYNMGIACDTINLCLLGDNIDCCGHAGYTNSMTHLMPENMDPRDQFNSFIELYDWFVHSLYETFNCNINVYSVPTGNHSGNLASV